MILKNRLLIENAGEISWNLKGLSAKFVIFLSYQQIVSMIPANVSAWSKVRPGKKWQGIKTNFAVYTEKNLRKEKLLLKHLHVYILKIQNRHVEWRIGLWDVEC